MYGLIRPLLFRLEPETAHHLVFNTLRILLASPLKSLLTSAWGNTAEKTVDVAGLKFRHPLGLAAGFDKDGILHPHWGSMGFSFVELGTVTPRPQAGNPKPRLFRLPQDQALINRMGFNNLGVDALAQKLRNVSSDIIIGGNIGKNKDTPNESAHEDYLYCLQALAPFVDYFTLNISSPNTPNLRALQEKEPLQKLISSVVQASRNLKTPRPVFVKIAPDLSESALGELLDVLLSEGVQGVVATNTTLSRENLLSPKQIQQQAGGLSGKPLKNKSTEVIRFIHRHTGGILPVIGAGGIFCADDALEKLDAGASLVQIYTGYIYQGPSLPRDILKRI